MEFVKVLDKNELPPNQMKLVAVKGKELLLANVDGNFYAIANRCTHLGGSLVKGKLENGVVTCPKHGAQFDVKTGKAVGWAKIAFVTMKVRDEESFPVRVEGEDVLVGIS